ncbi:tetratricopeptide repeat protein [Parafilimonas sp.]|jgi:tetratricopeptide (TPR) repeat protein|uniref:tetratricopeptide repeat protein n=1 Tax=Parafilimonas sp. TaxID=1969739 RepID=UPI003F7DDDF3
MAEAHVHEAKTGDTSFNMERFWFRNQKPIIAVIIAIVVIAGGWFAYQNYVVAPKEAEAQNAMWKAEQYFREDSLKLALNGDQYNRGFIYVMNNYGSTKTGKLAKYYAGLCYLKTGDFNKAVENLKDFNTSAKQIQMMAYGALGDAYSELNKNDEAVASYKKAAAEFTDDATMSSEYLFRAALKLETVGKTTEALDLYKELKEKFPNTNRGFAADKYIYRLSIVPNDFSTK